jgi:hypothetical protein
MTDEPFINFCHVSVKLPAASTYVGENVTYKKGRCSGAI